ncbi:MAG: hypothetical protein ABIG20_00340 [archaeon]
MGELMKDNINAFALLSKDSGEVPGDVIKQIKTADAKKIPVFILPPANAPTFIHKLNAGSLASGVKEAIESGAVYLNRDVNKVKEVVERVKIIMNQHYPTEQFYFTVLRETSMRLSRCSWNSAVQEISGRDFGRLVVKEK